MTTQNLDSLFILRHAQRSDKIATTISSIDFVHPQPAGSASSSSSNMAFSPYNYSEFDSFNPPLATFENTSNKSNNGYSQSVEMGTRLLSYIYNHQHAGRINLLFHTSPYLRCVQTIKYVVDTIVKKHRCDDDTPHSSKHIAVCISIDHVLSEWLSSDLDINLYPPNDNGSTLLEYAVQYLSSNIPFHKNPHVSIELNLHQSYANGNPGCFNENLLQQYSRLNNGLISIVKNDYSQRVSADPDVSNIILVMTHGACVRTLVSKLLAKPLYVEIPLSSMTIAKPVEYLQSKYFWKLAETDIEIPNGSTEFPKVNLYNRSIDSFYSLKTTFMNKESHLNFNNNLTKDNKNMRKFNENSLLNSRLKRGGNADEDDSDSDSDDGIVFNVRPSTRFRSSSLITNDKGRPVVNGRRPQPIDKFRGRSRNLERASPTPVPQPLQVLDEKPKFQNIDINDGILISDDEDTEQHDQEINYDSYKMPELECTSSGNSSSNSLIDDLTIQPGSFSKLTKSNSISSLPSSTNLSSLNSQYNRNSNESISQLLQAEAPQYSRNSNESISQLLQAEAPQYSRNSNESISQLLQAEVPQSNSSLSVNTIKNKSTTTLGKTKSSSLFDKSLIEESMEAHKAEEPEPEDDTEQYWFFNRSHGSTDHSTVAPVTEKKVKYSLNLYGDDDDEYKDDVPATTWFLGSNK